MAAIIAGVPGEDVDGISRGPCGLKITNTQAAISVFPRHPLGSCHRRFIYFFYFFK